MAYLIFISLELVLAPESESASPSGIRTTGPTRHKIIHFVHTLSLTILFYCMIASICRYFWGCWRCGGGAKRAAADCSPGDPPPSPVRPSTITSFHDIHGSKICPRRTLSLLFMLLEFQLDSSLDSRIDRGFITNLINTRSWPPRAPGLTWGRGPATSYRP